MAGYLIIHPHQADLVGNKHTDGILGVDEIWQAQGHHRR